MGPRGMYLNKWDLSCDLEKDTPTAVPIWVKLPQLLLPCWNDEYLHAIGNRLEKYIANQTLNPQCYPVPGHVWKLTWRKSFQRLSFSQWKDGTTCRLWNMRKSFLNVKCAMNMGTLQNSVRKYQSKMQSNPQVKNGMRLTEKTE